MYEMGANRRPRRRYGPPDKIICPADSCLLCRILARIDPIALSFVNQRTERLSLDDGDAVPQRLLSDGAVTIVTAGMVVSQRILCDGRRQVVSFCGAGDPLTRGKSISGVTAFASIPSRLCYISADTIATLKRMYPDAAIQLCELGNFDCDQRIEHLILLGRTSVPEKVAYLLHTQAARNGSHIEGLTAFDLTMSREDIADYLGINAETVSRQLTAMKKAGLIRLPKPDRVEVPDSDALAEMLPFRPAASASVR